jgi:hypothetical protein
MSSYIYNTVNDEASHKQNKQCMYNFLDKMFEWSNIVIKSQQW